jgi:hypothetical protein
LKISLRTFKPKAEQARETAKIARQGASDIDAAHSSVLYKVEEAQEAVASPR